jgi:hypothetical protein
MRRLRRVEAPHSHRAGPPHEFFERETMTISHTRVRPMALCFFVLTLLTPLGCKNAGGEGQSGASISGPLTMLPEYNTRAPRTCSKVTSPPSAAQAAVLVQCTMDSVSATGLGLFQDVRLDLGGSRAFVYWTDAGLESIDMKAQVYPLQGSYTGYFCTLASASLNGPGQNCIKSAVPKAQGWCWKTSFGEWKCKMQGGAPDMVNGPGPKTF